MAELALVRYTHLGKRINVSHYIYLQISMSARPTQTTVHRSVPTLQAALPVAAIVGTVWTLMGEPALVSSTHVLPDNY